MLEVQPLLLDLHSASAAASSSSSDDDDDGAGNATVVAGVGNEADVQVQQAQLALEQLGARVDVAEPANSSWRRALLQLQHVNEGTTSSDERQRIATEHAAAAGRWLAAYSSSRAAAAGAVLQDAATPSVVSLRCWYDARFAEVVQTLQAGLPAELAGVCQLVPVVSCVAGSWACVEVLWC